MQQLLELKNKQFEAYSALAEKNIAALEQENKALKERIKELEKKPSNTVVSKNETKPEEKCEELPQPKVFTAIVRPLPNTDCAYTNNCFYNPGHEFKTFYAYPKTELMNKKYIPIRIVYNASIEINSIAIGFYTRMYHILGINQKFEFEVCQEPDVLAEATIKITPINGVPNVTPKKVMENYSKWREGEYSLTGNLLGIGRDLAVKNSDGSYRIKVVSVKPVTCGNFGIFTKDTVMRVIG